MNDWTVDDSTELYNIDGWGKGLFGINPEGHAVVRSPRHPSREVDLFALVQDIQSRGVQLPLLVRLSDVLGARIDELAGAFHAAIAKHDYAGVYRGVYPIKVNQQRHLVEEIVHHSRPHHMGLECGSKPELLVVIAEQKNPKALIICNGYKDHEFLELALLARKLGRNVVIVIEQLHEVHAILDLARELDVEPVVGVRSKLATRGVGRWSTSAGDRAKFGLTVAEMLELLEILRRHGRLGILRLLHFHIGSQISSIRAIERALMEGARTYCELMRLGAPMGILDLGGGVGVDYDGSQTRHPSSVNYDLRTYADVVVRTVKEACLSADVVEPTLVTECGRAMVAHGSVLIVPVVGVTRMHTHDMPEAPPEPSHPAMHKLYGIYRSIDRRDPMQAYEEARAVKDEALQRFNAGLSSLQERARIDELFWQVCRRLLRVLIDEDGMPDELRAIQRELADIYFCNFSVFQSAPDSWAIDQLFPVMPLHRLGERPKRRAVLTDLTCDSDGKIDRFIDPRDVKSVLELHEVTEEPYYLGIFLLGAYQEILGDLHNLFGDTNAVHVSSSDNQRGYRIRHLVEGDTVQEVLSFVQYERDHLLAKVRAALEEAYEDDRLTVAEGKRLLQRYDQAMRSYTYVS